ncbi:hypothetical protein PoB_007266200 [Plakobranchus ocellatus]|uniref:Uncharacterized protein n=1 Tax=Plakobranchus ocellatus TaxID=259542 RepID=A0AAV4DP69_9GAST|nr:hypothetical protein PoB_007266200 [Plakobranchus ocellatus]
MQTGPRRQAETSENGIEDSLEAWEAILERMTLTKWWNVSGGLGKSSLFLSKKLLPWKLLARMPGDTAKGSAMSRTPQRGNGPTSHPNDSSLTANGGQLN